MLFACDAIGAIDAEKYKPTNVSGHNKAAAKDYPWRRYRFFLALVIDKVLLYHLAALTDDDAGDTGLNAAAGEVVGVGVDS